MAKCSHHVVQEFKDYMKTHNASDTDICSKREKEK